jgi:ectoine hydroxylase
VVEPVEQILQDHVYVHPFKINAKVAMDGELWPWHQDYQFGRDGDGMPADHAVNVTVFLADVTEFNGPMIFLAGSHREGTISVRPRHAETTGWASNVAADLTFSFDREQICQLAQKYPLVAPKDPAGLALIFHPNVVHASVSTISPFDGTVSIVTYNAVHNVPQLLQSPRPVFLAARQTDPITALPGDAALVA